MRILTVKRWRTVEFSAMVVAPAAGWSYDRIGTDTGPMTEQNRTTVVPSEAPAG